MKRAWLLLALVVLTWCLVLTAVPRLPQSLRMKKDSLAARTAGLQRHDGFLPYYWDEKKGDILFELSPAVLGREFLYFTGLGSGVGSTEAFADRSSFGGGWVCRFRRVGHAGAGDSGEHQLCRSERDSGAAAFGGIQLSHFRAGFASSRSGAGRDRVGQCRIPCWSGTPSICCRNCGGRLAPWAA